MARGEGSGGVFKKDQFGNLVKVGAGSGQAVGGRSTPSAGGRKGTSRFQQLAASRGVDLAAEQARAQAQLEAEQRVGGTASSTLNFDRSATLAPQQILKTPGVLPGLDPSKLANVAAVFKAMITGEAINANVNNKFVKLGLEAAANNPLTTALVLSGFIGLGKAVAGKIGGLTIKEIGVAQLKNIDAANFGAGGIGTVAAYAKNTATIKATGSLLAKAGFTIAAAVFIQKAIETYPFAKFELAEAMDKFGYARVRAADEGRYDLVDAMNQMQTEVLNPEGWDYVLSVTPFANILRAAKVNIEAAVASTEVYNKLIEDKKIQQETGETDEDKWARVRAEQAAQDKAAVDYYNQERKKMVQWEQEAKAAARAAQGSDERKSRNADARFWADQAAKQRELEAADRQAIADFWIAYRKKALEAAEANRPSNLNFGLL